MKKVVVILCAFLIVCSTFTGCVGVESLELKNRLIIQGIGIDEKDGELSVSVQVLNTDTSSNPNSGNSPSDIVKLYTVTGPSVSEAIDKLTKMTGKDPLLSQNRIVVFGKSLSEKGLSPYLDDFIRSAENRETVLMAIADEKAEDIIYADLGEGVIPAREVEHILSSSNLNYNIINTKVYEFINKISDETACATAPVVCCKEDDEKDVISICSTAVFNEDKLVDEVDKDIASGLAWVNNKVEKGKFSVTINNNTNVTLGISKSKTKIKATVRDSKPYFIINVKCQLDCSEINDSIFNKKTYADIDSIGEAAQKQIKDYIENSINECIIKKQSDVFGFGTRLMRHEPKYFKSEITDWQATLPNISYEVSVQVKIKNIGGSAAALYGKQ